MCTHDEMIIEDDYPIESCEMELQGLGLEWFLIGCNVDVEMKCVERLSFFFDKPFSNIPF